jgi:hypothetical protein
MRLMHLYRCAGMAVAAGLIISCQPVQTDDNAANVAEDGAEAPPRPIVEPPMDRQGLLIAAMRAASAQATGQDDIEAQRALGGRRFEVRIRFGCQPDPPLGQAVEFRFDEGRRTLQFRAAPDLTLREPLAAQIAGELVEVVEGFWIKRPWLLTAACPAAGAPVENAETEVEADATPPQVHARVGIAQFFGEGYARTFQRQQRPYEATKTLAEDEAPSAEGYNLVLSGRLRRLPNRRVITCSAESPDLPPDCIVSAVIERLWIERPDSGDMVAEWGRG